MAQRKSRARLPIFSAAISIALLGTGFAAPASVGELGHYGPALADIRDYLQPPEPGFYAKQYHYDYTANSFRNADDDKVSSITGPLGGTIDLDVNVDVFVLAPAFLWLSDWTILGARYGAYIVPTFGNSSVGASLFTQTGFGRSTDQSNFGVGDLFVQPVWLGWNETHWDFVLGYGFYAPIGEFDAGAADNIGLGFWTHQFQGVAAWYPSADRTIAVVGALTYEINGEVEDSDITPGDRLSFNLGISRYKPIGGSKFLLEVGAFGYGQFQVTDDTGSDAVRPDVHDQIFGVGPQLGLTFLPWEAALTFKWAHELGAEDRFEGDNFTLNFAVAFWDVSRGGRRPAPSLGQVDGAEP